MPVARNAPRKVEGRCLPMAVRDLVDNPLAEEGPTAGPCHLGVCARFFEEHQTLGVEVGLPEPPRGLVERRVPLARPG